jgi:hypothetical protein
MLVEAVACQFPICQNQKGFVQRMINKNKFLQFFQRNRLSMKRGRAVFNIPIVDGFYFVKLFRRKRCKRNMHAKRLYQEERIAKIKYKTTMNTTIAQRTQRAEVIIISPGELCG